MTTTATQTITREAVERMSAQHNEPDWLLKRRLDAWRLFEEAPMPDPLSEEWKRTDATKLTLDGIAPYAAAERIDGANGLAAPLRSLWDEREELAARVVQVDRRSGKIRDAAGVREKFGVDPALIPDFLALVGDNADGYPGIARIGAVTAARLITEHGPIEPEELVLGGMVLLDDAPKGK